MNVKKYPNITAMSTETFLSQPLWNNRLFVYKGKTLFFKELSKSNLLYVKDIVDVNGLKSLNWFYENLILKRNSLCQYNIMKSVFSSLICKGNIDFTKSLYFNKSSTLRIQFQGDKFFSEQNCTCKFFYEILVNKNSNTPFTRLF